MKKIGLLIGLIIICNVGAAWADPTVKEILQKKMDIDNSIVAFESKMINEWYYPETNLISSNTGYIWRKSKNLYRLEAYDELGAIESTTISNDTGTYLSNQSGTFVMDKRDDPSVPAETPSEEDIIGEDIDKFLEYYDGVIKEQNGDIYTLRITPKDKSVYYQQIWIEEVIDYVKGIELKSLISGVDDSLITSTEFFDISQLDGIWFSKSKTIKTRTENGNIITNIVKYEDIKINQNVDDNLFEIEMP